MSIVTQNLEKRLSTSTIGPGHPRCGRFSGLDVRMPHSSLVNFVPLEGILIDYLVLEMVGN